jgi:hypothetical protein
VPAVRVVAAAAVRDVPAVPVVPGVRAGTLRGARVVAADPVSGPASDPDPVVAGAEAVGVVADRSLLGVPVTLMTALGVRPGSDAPAVQGATVGHQTLVFVGVGPVEVSGVRFTAESVPEPSAGKEYE